MSKQFPVYFSPELRAAYEESHDVRVHGEFPIFVRQLVRRAVAAELTRKESLPRFDKGAFK